MPAGVNGVTIKLPRPLIRPVAELVTGWPNSAVPPSRLIFPLLVTTPEVDPVMTMRLPSSRISPVVLLVKPPLPEGMVIVPCPRISPLLVETATFVMLAIAFTPSRIMVPLFVSVPVL